MFGFTRFISPVVISIFWIICIIAHFFGVIGIVYFIFTIDIDGALGDGRVRALVAFPVPSMALFSLLQWRIFFEFLVIVFRIETDTRESKMSLQAIESRLLTIDTHFRATRKSSEKETVGEEMFVNFFQEPEV